MTEISSRTIWTLTIGITIITFVFRYSFIALFGRINEVPEPIETALSYVPPAVLAALVMPALLAPNNAVEFSLSNHALLAGAVAALAAWRTESMLATIIAGMGFLWLLKFLPF